MHQRRPVLNYFGGKFRLARWITGMFPGHETYVEPFGGAASVLLAKPASRIEIYNDLNEDLVNLFRVLRDPAAAGALYDRLALTLYARRSFEEAYAPADEAIERAVRMVVRSFLGFSNVAALRKSGFKTMGTGPASSFASWRNAVASFTERLSTVIIECRPAIEIIERFDGPRTLFYVDPPYVLSARSDSARVYPCELSDDDHRDLLAVLRMLKGRVVLSGYPSPLYDESLQNWRRIERPARNGAHGQATEVVWMNR